MTDPFSRTSSDLLKLVGGCLDKLDTNIQGIQDTGPLVEKLRLLKEISPYLNEFNNLGFSKKLNLDIRCHQLEKVFHNKTLSSLEFQPFRYKQAENEINHASQLMDLYPELKEVSFTFINDPDTDFIRALSQALSKLSSLKTLTVNRVPPALLCEFVNKKAPAILVKVEDFAELDDTFVSLYAALSSNVQISDITFRFSKHSSHIPPRSLELIQNLSQVIKAKVGCF